MEQERSTWPDLRYETWRETAATLQLWTQVIGKVRLGLAPWVNHSWQVPLYVTARGLTTSPMPFAGEILELEFDFVHHRLLWWVLLRADTVLTHFRSGFLGKVSPVHFFWGSFDLAVTRFSGRRAPPRPGGIPGLSDAVTREAYSHEVSSAGFWPGNDGFPRAAFYSYAYPEPAGFSGKAVTPGASYNKELGEFVLPYDQMRQAADPEATLLDFLTRTYAAAADAGQWDRAALECGLGVPGRVRPMP